MNTKKVMKFKTKKKDKGQAVRSGMNDSAEESTLNVDNVLKLEEFSRVKNGNSKRALTKIRQKMIGLLGNLAFKND